MQELAQLEPLARDTPQTKRGHERCLALLLSANELFLKHGYDAVSRMILSSMRVVPKHPFINFLAIKKAYLRLFVIIAVNNFLKIFVYRLNKIKII